MRRRILSITQTILTRNQSDLSELSRTRMASFDLPSTPRRDRRIVYRYCCVCHDMGMGDRQVCAFIQADRHMSSLLCPDAFLSPLELDAVVTRALAEDLGRAGDVTSIATVPEGTRGRAIVVARKGGTISGLPMVEATLRKLDPAASITAHHRDGDTIGAKAQLLTIEADARA